MIVFFAWRTNLFLPCAPGVSHEVAKRDLSSLVLVAVVNERDAIVVLGPI